MLALCMYVFSSPIVFAVSLMMVYVNMHWVLTDVCPVPAHVQTVGTTCFVSTRNAHHSSKIITMHFTSPATLVNLASMVYLCKCHSPALVLRRPLGQQGSSRRMQALLQRSMSAGTVDELLAGLALREPSVDGCSLSVEDDEHLPEDVDIEALSDQDSQQLQVGRRPSKNRMYIAS
jgi:hypothetical protein